MESWKLKCGYVWELRWGWDNEPLNSEWVFFISEVGLRTPEVSCFSTVWGDEPLSSEETAMTSPETVVMQANTDSPPELTPTHYPSLFLNL